MKLTERRTTGRPAGARLLGLVTTAAGVLIAAGALLSVVTEWAWPAILVGFVLLVYVVPRIHGLQAPADGWPGRIGAPVATAGVAVIALLGLVFLVWEAFGTPGEPAWTGVLWMFGFLSFLVGMVLFGIGTAMARHVPPAPALLMVAGLVAAVAVDMATGAFFEDDGSTTEWGFFIGVPVFGAGLAWMGYALRSGQLRRASEPTTR